VLGIGQQYCLISAVGRESSSKVTVIRQLLIFLQSDYCSGISVLGIGQQYCLISAVGLESPSKVTVIRQLQIVLAYVIQVCSHCI
jgi:hypothetical protein